MEGPGRVLLFGMCNEETCRSWKGHMEGVGERQSRTPFPGRGEHAAHQSAAGGSLVGEESFHDVVSTVFGPKEEAKMFELSMWP